MMEGSMLWSNRGGVARVRQAKWLCETVCGGDDGVVTRRAGQHVVASCKSAGTECVFSETIILHVLRAIGRSALSRGNPDYLTKMIQSFFNFVWILI